MGQNEIQSEELTFDGNVLRIYRQNLLDWSQERLGKSCGVARATISKIERTGCARPSQLDSIIDAINAEIDRLRRRGRPLEPLDYVALRLSVDGSVTAQNGPPVFDAPKGVNAITVRELSDRETTDLSEVWVYSKRPLELAMNRDHLRLRRQVCNNLISGVKYTYFVESIDGVGRIRALLDQMAADHEDSSVETLLAGTTAVVLDPDRFLTYYCLHVHKNGHVVVFQDVLRPNDDHILIALEPEHASNVFWLLRQFIQSGIYETHYDIKTLVP